MPSIMPYFQQELNPAVSEATTSMLLRLRSVPFSTGLASASVVKNKSACLSLVSRLHRRLVGTAGVPFKRPGAASGGAADGAGSLAPPHAPGLAFAVGPRGEMLDQQEFMNIPTIKTRILRNSYATVVGVASDVSYLLRSMILFYQGAASHLARVMSAAEFFCQDVVGMEAALTNIRPSPVPDGCKICFLDKPAGSSRLVRCKYCLKQFHESCYQPRQKLDSPSSSSEWICDECFHGEFELEYILALREPCPTHGAARELAVPVASKREGASRPSQRISSTGALTPSSRLPPFSFPQPGSFGSPIDVTRRWVALFTKQNTPPPVLGRNLKIEARTRELMLTKSVLSPGDCDKVDSDAENARKRCRVSKQASERSPNDAKETNSPSIDSETPSSPNQLKQSFLLSKGQAIAESALDAATNSLASQGSLIGQFLLESFIAAQQASIQGRWPSPPNSANGHGTAKESAHEDACAAVFRISLQQWIHELIAGAFESEEFMLKTQRSKSRSAADASSASQACNKPQRFVAKLRRLLSLDRNKYLLSRLSQMLELGSMQQMGPPTKELPENLFLLAQRLAIEHTVMSMVDATSLFLGQQFSDASPMPSRGRPNAVHKAPSELGGGGGTGASASASGTNNMGIETPKPAAGPVLSPASQRIGGETVHKNSQRSLLDLFIERFVSGRMDKEECGRWCQNIAADLVARVPAPRLQLQLRRDVALYGQRKDYTWRPYEVGGGDSGSETTSRDIQNHASHAGSNSSGPSNSMLCQRNRPREDVCQGTTSDSVCELFVVFHAALQATAVQARRSGTTPAGAAQTAVRAFFFTATKLATLVARGTCSLDF